MNPTIKKLAKEILDTPELKYQKNSTKGVIAATYYTKRKCDVVYWAPDGSKRTIRSINYPKDGDGVFHESLKAGDIVDLSFKGKTQQGIFISGVQKKNKSTQDFETIKGQDIPISTNLF